MNRSTIILVLILILVAISAYYFFSIREPGGQVTRIEGQCDAECSGTEREMRDSIPMIFCAKNNTCEATQSPFPGDSVFCHCILFKRPRKNGKEWVPVPGNKEIEDPNMFYRCWCVRPDL